MGERQSGTVSFLCTDLEVSTPPGDPEQTDQVILAAPRGEVSEAEFRDWIAARCG